MAQIPNDLRFAARSLARNPGFAAVAVITLALGIGASTAVFSVVNGVLLRPLSYPDPDRVVMVWSVNQEQGWDRAGMSRPDVASVRELAALESVEGYAPGVFALTSPEGAQLVSGAYVTGGILQVFGVAPTLGRDLRHEENHPLSAERVVVVSHNLWQRRLGADPNVLGTLLQRFRKRATRSSAWRPRGSTSRAGRSCGHPTATRATRPAAAATWKQSRA